QDMLPRGRQVVLGVPPYHSLERYLAYRLQSSRLLLRKLQFCLTKLTPRQNHSVASSLLPFAQLATNSNGVTCQTLRGRSNGYVNSNLAFPDSFNLARMSA